MRSDRGSEAPGGGKISRTTKAGRTTAPLICRFYSQPRKFLDMRQELLAQGSPHRCAALRGSGERLRRWIARLWLSAAAHGVAIEAGLVCAIGTICGGIK